MTAVAPAERVTVERAADALLAHLEALGRKCSTVTNYRSHGAALAGRRPNGAAAARAPLAMARRVDLAEVGRARSVPLPDRVAAALETLSRRGHSAGDGDLVFALTGEPLTHSQMTKRFKATLGRAGLRPTAASTTCATFGTTMAGAGVPMTTLQAWLGHAHISTTMIYAHYVPGDAEAAVVDAAFAPRAPVGVAA